jgi:NADH-quinone oxidoreductase subunit E
MLPVLTRLQKERGWISEETVEQVAAYLGVGAAHVHGVVSFYSMYDRAPVGRNKVYVCRTLSCRLRGAEDVIRSLEGTLGVKRGETTPDGKFTIVPFECLGLCEQAPAALCGERRWGNLTPESAKKVIEDLA